MKGKHQTEGYTLANIVRIVFEKELLSPAQAQLRIKVVERAQA